MPAIVNRQGNIKDESHAKALARNWISNGEFLCHAKVQNLTFNPNKRSRKSFIKSIDKIESTWGELVVNRRCSNTRGKLSTNKPRFIEIAVLSKRLSFDFHKSKLLPINVMLFDTKKFEVGNIVTSFNLSEHLLARVIMRSNACSLKDIADWAKQYYSYILQAEMRNILPTTDFILLTKDTYIPFTFLKEIPGRNGLVAKTWVPKSEWSKATTCKANMHLENLKNQETAVFIDSKALN